MVSRRRRNNEPPNASLDEILDQPDADEAVTVAVGTPSAAASGVSDESTAELPRDGLTESIWRPGAGEAGTASMGTVQDDLAAPPDNGIRSGAGVDLLGAGDEGILDDDDFLPQQPKRVPRLTVALVGVLVLGFGLLGGIWVQKSFGAQSSASGFPGGAAGFPGGSGMPGGSGLPGGSGMPGGGRSGNGGTGGSGTGTADTGTTDAPAVVGTVASVSSDQLSVEDFGGTKHEVTLTEKTTLTAPLGHRELKSGDTVSVVGTTSGTTITATAITVS